MSIALGKITDVRVPYGSVDLHGTEVEDHGSWIMVKIQYVTERDSAQVVPGAWMIGRQLPVAVSSL